MYTEDSHSDLYATPAASSKYRAYGQEKLGTKEEWGSVAAICLVAPFWCWNWCKLHHLGLSGTIRICKSI